MKKVVLMSIMFSMIFIMSSCSASKCASSSDHLYAQNHKKNQKYSNRAYIKKVNHQQKGNKRKRKK
jgi:hypothetical protein